MNQKAFCEFAAKAKKELPRECHVRGAREVLKYAYSKTLIATECGEGQRRSFATVFGELVNTYNLLRIQNGFSPVADAEEIMYVFIQSITHYSG